MTIETASLNAVADLLAVSETALLRAQGRIMFQPVGSTIREQLGNLYDQLRKVQCEVADLQVKLARSKKDT